MEAEAKIAESVNNEIQLENFEIQAKKINIMKLKSTPCKSKFWGFIEYTVDDNYLMYCYAELFNYLVKKEIIISKIDVGTFFTADFVYTLPKPFIHQTEFQKRINSTNSDYPEILKCYTIDNTKLYNLLKNYKYNITDEYVRKVEILGEIPHKTKSPTKSRIKSPTKLTKSRSLSLKHSKKIIKGGRKSKTKQKLK
jgi:hypothetical protein